MSLCWDLAPLCGVHARARTHAGMHAHGAGLYVVDPSKDLTVLKEEEEGWFGSAVGNRDETHPISL